MSSTLDRLICIDIESTCEEDRSKQHISEIIEIGLCIINLSSLQIEEKESIIVKPTRSKISKYCTDLTTLTQDQVDKGVLFKDACDILKSKYNSKNRTFASWGAYDRKMFESQCRETCIDYPFGRDHINIKNLFGVFYGLQKELNVPKALDYLNMQFEGRLHTGLADACNISKIFINMIKKHRNK